MAVRTGAAESPAQHDRVPNGVAMAAFLGAGIGAFAMGLVVILNEAVSLRRRQSMVRPGESRAARPWPQWCG